MLNINALKALYVALGGTASDVADMTTSAEVINAIAGIVGSTIELPAVSSADNGMVLTVVNGKWAKASIPSQLPAVTPEDAGSVLKVNESGVWAKGTDATE